MKSPDIRRSYRSFMAISFAALLLAACGQYGPLYLPPAEPATASTPAPEETPQPVQESEPQEDKQPDDL